MSDPPNQTSKLTQELNKLIKEGDLAPVTKFFTNDQLHNDNVGYSKLLLNVQKNFFGGPPKKENLNDDDDNADDDDDLVTATPLITSYVVGWQKQSLETFHFLLDKHISIWKEESHLSYIDVCNKYVEHYHDPHRHRQDRVASQILPRLNLLDLICFNCDVDSFTRLVRGLMAAPVEAEDVASMIHRNFLHGNGSLNDLSPLGICFVYGTPEFVNSIFATLRDVFEQHQFDAFMKHLFEEGDSSNALMNLCRWISDVGNVELLFDNFRNVGGRDLLRGKFRSYYKEYESTLAVAVLRDQKSFDVVSEVIGTAVDLRLPNSQFEALPAVFAEICRNQNSLEIIRYAFEKIRMFLDDVAESVGKNQKLLIHADSLIRCALAACEINTNPHVLNYLFDSAFKQHSDYFNEFMNLSSDDEQDEDDEQFENRKQNILVSLVNAARNGNFTGVWMLLAHCSGEERCRELINYCADDGKNVASYAKSDEIQRFLENPEVWKESMEKYKSVFDDEVPIVPPWSPVYYYWWVRRIVEGLDDSEGLTSDDPKVLDLLTKMGEIKVTDRKSLGHCNRSKLKQVLNEYCPSKTLRSKIDKLAKLEYKKQHPSDGDDDEEEEAEDVKAERERQRAEDDLKEALKQFAPNNAASATANDDAQVFSLPFLTEIFTKHSIASPLSAASTKILFDNEINSLEIFLQLTDQDLKDLSLPLGAQKVIKEAQKRCTSASSGVSALSRLIASEFASNCIFLSSDIKFDENHPQPLGSGGGGDVFKATLARTNRPVAVKRFRNVLPDQAIKECKIAMKLHHKNIIAFVGVSVFTFQNPYIYEEIRAIIELGQGTLQQTLSSTSLLSWEKVLRYSFEIASGLDYLHNHAKMNHLDLKPANVLLDENNIVKLCDFGLSRVMKNADDTHVTVTHAGFGTLRWMSHEQISSTQMRPSNDVYSFGCILYNMIDEQGRKPWYHLPDTNNRNDALLAELTSDSNKTESLLAKRISSEHRGDCPEFLLDLCKSCLNSDYEMRPTDGGELVQILKSGVLELYMKSEEWRKCLGDVGSYLGILYDENKSSASMGNSKSATNTSFESFS